MRWKRALQIGLGMQGGGVATAQYLYSRCDKLIIADKKSHNELAESVNALPAAIEYSFGDHTNDLLENTDIVVIGPSVKRTEPIVQEALRRSIPVRTETELFFLENTIPVIGITGTRGKTTTTTMIYEMLAASGFRVELGGNIPGKSALSLLGKKLDWVVLELSSWQLSGLHSIKKSPKIAVFTNFYPDHLNFYSSMDEYYFDKSAIYAYQKPGDTTVTVAQLTERIMKDHPLSRLIIAQPYSGKLKLKGEHNALNASLAATAARSAGVPDEVAKDVLSHFTGVPFRLEKIASCSGVDYYNDTTSTTPIAGIKAVEALRSYKRIFLIAGGNDKNLSYDDWIQTVNNSVEGVVMLPGSMTEKVLPSMKKLLLPKPSSLDEAYIRVSKEIRPGDVVLFSPSATSFATFKNEFDRGRAFNRIVRDTIKDS